MKIRLKNDMLFLLHSCVGVVLYAAPYYFGYVRGASSSSSFFLACPFFSLVFFCVASWCGHDDDDVT